MLSSPGDWGTDYYYSLLLVWQSGMGLVLGVLTQQEMRQGQTSFWVGPFFVKYFRRKLFPTGLFAIGGGMEEFERIRSRQKTYGVSMSVAFVLGIVASVVANRLSK